MGRVEALESGSALRLSARPPRAFFSSGFGIFAIYAARSARSWAGVGFVPRLFAAQLLMAIPHPTFISSPPSVDVYRYIRGLRCASLSVSQRPTHSGSIFRLLLKIAVGLPRSCDSSQFLQGFGPNKYHKAEPAQRMCQAQRRRTVIVRALRRLDAGGRECRTALLVQRFRRGPLALERHLV